MYVQNVLDQFELKLIQIQLRPEKIGTVVWPSVGMIITSNWHSQQTPSAKGGKGKIQRLDRVSCPDMEIQVSPNLGIISSTCVCKPKPFPARTKNWQNIQHNWKKSSSSPCKASVFVPLSVCLSICLWVRAKRGI